MQKYKKPLPNVKFPYDHETDIFMSIVDGIKVEGTNDTSIDTKEVADNKHQDPVAMSLPDQFAHFV